VSSKENKWDQSLNEQRGRPKDDKKRNELKSRKDGALIAQAIGSDENGE